MHIRFAIYEITITNVEMGTKLRLRECCFKSFGGQNVYFECTEN